MRRPQNFAKSPPIFCPMYCQSNNWQRFHKILWPSQNIGTLKTEKILLSKSIFWVKNDLNLDLFSFKNITFGSHFLLLKSFYNFNFQKKSKMMHNFWRLDTMISLIYDDFWSKTYLTLYPSLGNLINHIAIPCTGYTASHHTHLGKMQKCGASNRNDHGRIGTHCSTTRNHTWSNRSILSN